ncbi:MAG: hypothetical protein HPY66_0965 [Firmicutes bacterium]|nr:hypothetical protein [Bacillota bacterium]MDI6705974.1 hypothetical protein [Bacillota bacterium]
MSLFDITTGLPAGHVAVSTTDPKGNITTKICEKAGHLYQVKDGSIVTATYTYYNKYIDKFIDSG